MDDIRVGQAYSWHGYRVFIVRDISDGFITWGYSNGDIVVNTDYAVSDLISSIDGGYVKLVMDTNKWELSPFRFC